MYQNKYTIAIITAIVFLTGILPLQMSAQIRYTAVLPETDAAVPATANGELNIAANNMGTETARSLMLYKLNILPANARINMMTLKLYVSRIGSDKSFATQLVTVLKGTSLPTIPTSLSDPSLAWTDIKNNKSIGRDEVIEGTQSINLKLSIPANPDANYVSQFLGDGNLALAARSPQKGQNNYFYSSLTAQTRGNFSKKPKLIVKYEIGSPLFRENWAQNFSNAQHTGYLNWRTNGEITQAGVRSLTGLRGNLYAGADPTGAVLIYKNKPIVFTNSPTGVPNPYSVVQLDTRGDVVWTAPVNGVAKCWPMIDNNGRLYYFTSNEISILDLNNAGQQISTRSVTSITNSQANNIRDNATLGYDGTLYMVTDRGLIAMSAYPQLKIRWKYDNGADELTGPVSLSSDESRAYFISVDTRNRRSRLMVLDNMDGTVVDSSLYILCGYRDEGGNYYIPAPVVQGNDKIFVLDGYDNANKLFVFNSNMGTRKLRLAVTISATSSTNTGISQPVIDGASNVFFVYDHNVARYDTTKPTGIQTLSAPELDNASILVVDRSSGIYALDPYNGNKVYGFRYDEDSLRQSFMRDIEGAGLSEHDHLKKNLVLAADGTLYTISNNSLIAISPITTSQDNITLTGNDWTTNTLYRANKSIIVDKGIVYSTINTILQSRGTISFKRGFHVQRGAKLSFKAGN